MTAATPTDERFHLKPDPWAPAVKAPMPRSLKRHIWLAVLITAAIIIPRSVMIARAQSSSCDDDYHVFRGLMLLRGEMDRLRHYYLNDPCVGEAIVAIPAWFNGVHLKDNLDVFMLPGDVPPGPKNEFTPSTALKVETAIWKCLLFLPAVAVMFHWLASIYSVRSAWLAVGVLLVEPTLAAHLPLPTLDVIGMEGILVACWAIWRFVEQPSDNRLAAAGMTMGLAMTLKHTALILPGVAIVLAAAHWLGRLGLWRKPADLMARVRRTGYVALLVLLTIWALFRFDFSVPVVDPFAKPILGQSLFADRIVPAGIYIGSIFKSLDHLRNGHPSYLWGQVSLFSWWYYFPAVATYKIPLGIAAIFLLGFLSLVWVRPRYEELPLLLCGTMWMIAMARQPIGIGFRHFLPAELFLVMLASRCLAGRAPIAGVLSWLCIASAAAEMVYWAPNYMSYVNFPRKDIWMQISDSNLDWGQSRIDFKHWLEAPAQDGRLVYYAYFGPVDVDLYKEFGPRLTQYNNLAHWVRRAGTKPNSSPDILPDKYFVMPKRGILVVSPVAMTGQYDAGDHFKQLRDAHIEPDSTIGHNLLVYDLDRLHAEGKLR